MITNNKRSQPHTRQGLPLLSAVIYRLALTVMVACAVTVFAESRVLGSIKLHATDNSASDKPATSKTLVATEGVEHLERLTREPMVIELSDGSLFVAGYDGDLEKSSSLYRSRDHGAAWERVNVGSKADGAIGNSDVDLAVGRDDTLYFVQMTFDIKTDEGSRIAVGASKNAGAKWSWKILSETRFDDRPWIGVAPDGTAHVIWNDGNGARYEVSQDRGASWNERPRIETHREARAIFLGHRAAW